MTMKILDWEQSRDYTDDEWNKVIQCWHLLHSHLPEMKRLCYKLAVDNFELPDEDEFQVLTIDTKEEREDSLAYVTDDGISFTHDSKRIEPFTLHRTVQGHLDRNIKTRYYFYCDVAQILMVMCEKVVPGVLGDFEEDELYPELLAWGEQLISKGIDNEI